MTYIGSFMPQGLTEIQTHSELAIFIINYLVGRRDPSSGAWPHEWKMRHLRYTCHVVDAIAELNSPQLSHRLVDPAVRWLCDLPIIRDLPPEEMDAVRLYPSRFKTLAALGRFNVASVQRDFGILRRHFDPHSGWLIEVPGGTTRMLTTLIWIDTLLCLHGGRDTRSWPAELPVSLNAISTSFTKWLQTDQDFHHEPSEPPDATAINRLSDASYAFDLLVQAGHLIAGQPDYERARNAICNAIQVRSPEQMQETDYLYCGLQLARHCGDNHIVQEVVSGLINDLKARYEAGEYNRAEDHFHAISLRLLINFHGEPLRDVILDTLLQRDKEYTAKQQKDETEKQRLAFEQLILAQIRVNLATVTRLSGSDERAAVHRIQFSVRSEATYEDGRAFSVPPDLLHLIVKKGSYDALLHSIDQYQKLPDVLRSHFAKHTRDLSRFGETQEWYLVMEDLATMSPLSEFISRFDPQITARLEYDQLAALADAVCDALQALHTHSQHAPLLGKQFWRLYYVPITESIEQLCSDDAYPRLKRYLHSRFESNGWRYRPFNAYLEALVRHAEKLAPPQIGLVHGDCHSRNIMIDERPWKAKFIDLEMFREDDDYLIDYGLLLEDIAIYLYLPHLRRSRGLVTDEIVALPDQDPQSRKNAINYPALPRDSEAALAFQRLILRRLEEFAGRIEDGNWKDRLWLAIIRNLLMLGSRQSSYLEKDRRRREERYRSILVCFAEATRLLSELVAWLDTPERGNLPDIPFSGQLREPLPEPFPHKELRRALIEIDPQIVSAPLPRQPYITAYSIHDRVFAEIKAEPKPAELFLAGERVDFLDPHNLARPSSDGRNGIVVLLQTDVALADVLDLVRQAYRLVTSSQ